MEIFMILTSCKKALILEENSDITLCEVIVANIDNDTVTLYVDDDYLDDFDAQMLVTFLDEQKGLVTCKCNMMIQRKFNASDGRLMHTIQCALLEQTAILQRRQDFKIKLNIPIDIIIPADIELPENCPDVHESFNGHYTNGTTDNLSAGGIHFKCPIQFRENTELEVFMSLEHNQRVKLHLFILRVDIPAKDAEDKQYGYGCQFINIQAATETALRNFVFKQQMINRKRNRD